MVAAYQVCGRVLAVPIIVIRQGIEPEATDVARSKAWPIDHGDRVQPLENGAVLHLGKSMVVPELACTTHDMLNPHLAF